jgi:hypothetical protein
MRPYLTWRRAVGRWALDSGGFTELTMPGAWQTSVDAYASAVHRYCDEIGGLDWAVPQHWMCELESLARSAPGPSVSGGAQADGLGDVCVVALPPLSGPPVVLLRAAVGGQRQPRSEQASLECGSRACVQEETSCRQLPHECPPLAHWNACFVPSVVLAYNNRIWNLCRNKTPTSTTKLVQEVGKLCLSWSLLRLGRAWSPDVPGLGPGLRRTGRDGFIPYFCPVCAGDMKENEVFVGLHQHSLCLERAKRVHAGGSVSGLGERSAPWL